VGSDDSDGQAHETYYVGNDIHMPFHLFHVLYRLFAHPKPNVTTRCNLQIDHMLPAYRVSIAPELAFLVSKGSLAEL
jgi:hypothetical protein